jgi:pimeloyl-ACP methyl ester carboxylesterase
MFQRYAAAADVIVLDQRGFSARGTRLRTPHVAGGALDRPGSVVATAEAWRTLAAAAGPANPGRDLSAYTVTECAADVAELAAALGYPRISLLGTSFGSQWAFAVMRRYPELVARAVLSGVEPLDHGFDMPSSVLAAMQRIAADADVDPVLQPYLPEGGLMAALAALRERFAGGPIRVEVADATSGAKHTVVLGLEDLQAAVIPSDADAWPAFVLALYHGHYEDWARAELAARTGPMFGDTALINPLIDAGLGVTATRARRLEADPAIYLLGTWSFAPHRLSRAAWPTPDLGDALRMPAPTAIPTVFVQGDWDTSTPIENLADITPAFPASHTIVVHRGEHAQPSRLTRDHPAVFAAIVEFFRTGATAGLPDEIALPVPAFVVPSFPPPARH